MNSGGRFMSEEQKINSRERKQGRTHGEGNERERGK